MLRASIKYIYLSNLLKQNKFLSICFTRTVNETVINLQNFKKLQLSSDVSVNSIVTCPDVYIPISLFADYFGMLVQQISPSINDDLLLYK